MTEIEFGSRQRDSLFAYESFHWAVAFVLMALASIVADLLSLDWVEAALVVATGALAGYLTNDIAITLLFWPTRKRWGLYGIFFARKDEFGKKLIDQACERVLTPKWFTDLIQDQPVKETLGKSVRGMIQELASRELGTPRSIMADFLENEEQREGFADSIAAGAGNYISGQLLEKATEEEIYKLLRGGLSLAGKEHIGQWLGGREEICALVGDLLRSATEGPSRPKLIDWLTQKIHDIPWSDREFSEILPADMRARITVTAKSYVTRVAGQELNKLVSDGDFRAKVGRLIRDELRRLVNAKVEGIGGLKGWLIRVFAAKDINEVLDRVPSEVDSWLLKLPTLLSQREMSNYITELVGRAMSGLWEARPSDFKKWLPRPVVKDLVDAGLDVVGSEPIRRQIADTIAQLLSPTAEQVAFDEAVEGRGQALDTILRQVSKHIAGVLEREQARKQMQVKCRILTRRVLLGFLDAPLGRLADNRYLATFGVDTLANAAANITVSKLNEFGPTLVKEFRVEVHLRRLWDGLDNDQMRSTVESVLATQFRELINWGITLGAAVGFLSIALQTSLGARATGIFLIVAILGYRLFKSRVVNVANTTH